MKTALLVCLSAWYWVAKFPPARAGEPVPQDPRAATPGSVHEEIERLRDEFDRRRTKTLRPSSARYLAQLEALQKSVLEQNRAVEAELEAALKSAREAYAQVDQPELRQALLGGLWIWRSDREHNAVVVTFRSDGAAEHIGMRGQWRLTGPNEVTIATDGDGAYVLRFNASLRVFQGDRDGITVTAVQSPVDTLCGNLWSLRGDKLEFRRDGRLVQRGDGWEGQDWHLSDDGTQVTITFTNGNGGTFKFENGTMTHFDGSPFRRTPRD